MATSETTTAHLSKAQVMETFANQRWDARVALPAGRLGDGPQLRQVNVQRRGGLS